MILTLGNFKATEISLYRRVNISQRLLQTEAVNCKIKAATGTKGSLILLPLEIDCTSYLRVGVIFPPNSKAMGVATRHTMGEQIKEKSSIAKCAFKNGNKLPVVLFPRRLVLITNPCAFISSLRVDILKLTRKLKIWNCHITMIHCHITQGGTQSASVSNCQFLFFYKRTKSPTLQHSSDSFAIPAIWEPNTKKSDRVSLLI